MKQTPRTALVLLAALAALAPGGRGALAGSAADAVVAFVDTGINPYHVTFRDTSARAYTDPATYLPGYPRSATALSLTFDAPDYWSAVHADCERVWKHVKPGKLYWFPGTKIVGAISFLPEGDVDCDQGQPGGMLILDSSGHGTMTASRGGSVEYGACKQCRVVSIQFPTSLSFTEPEASTQPAVDAITWAAGNSSWIDAQSNSWGPFLPAWDPTGKAGLFTANPQLVRAVEDVSRRHLAFWASGNGALFRFGGVGHPTLLAPHFTPSAIMVGGLDSGYMIAWSGFPPHVVSDACSSWAAKRNTYDESGDRVGGGTSGATPFAAGGAARMLIAAREILGDARTGVRAGVVAEGPAGLVPGGPLADGVFTLEEWKRVVFTTASPRPVRQFEDGAVCDRRGDSPYNTTPLLWRDVPPEYPEYLQIGYGAVDAQSFERALAVLRGEAPLPDRSRTDAYFDVDRQAREALYPVFAGP